MRAAAGFSRLTGARAEFLFVAKLFLMSPSSITGLWLPGGPAGQRVERPLFPSPTRRASAPGMAVKLGVDAPAGRVARRLGMVFRSSRLHFCSRNTRLRSPGGVFRSRRYGFRCRDGCFRIGKRFTDSGNRLRECGNYFSCTSNVFREAVTLFYDSGNECGVSGNPSQEAEKSLAESGN